MSNVIAFLEALGRDTTIPASGEGFAATVEALGLDDRAQAALLAKDAGALSDLLGGRGRMLCSLFPADEDEKRDEEQEDEDDDAPGKDMPTAILN